MTKDLYRRAVQVDEDVADDNAVVFDSFVGIAPRRYADLFEMPKRKDERGVVIEWNRAKANPKIDRYTSTYIELEKTIRVFLLDREEKLGLVEQSAASLEGGASA